MFLIFYLTFIIYEEVLYKLVNSSNFYLSIVNAFFYYLAIATFLALITEVLPEKIAKHFLRIITFIISFWYGATIIVKKTFDITISINSLSMADQFVGGGFMSLLLSVLKQNIDTILLIIIPFLISIIISIFYHKKEFTIKKLIIKLVIIVVSFLLFIGSLFVFDIDNYGLKELYFNKRNNNSNVEYFGVLPSLLIDIRKEATGFKEEIIFEHTQEEPVVEEKEELKVYEKQVQNIDFVSLIENEKNDAIKQMHIFFNQETPTIKNDFTGLYKGKNLIYIMAESFDGFAVDKDSTPTLYKMIHDGFYFTNFYSTTNLSTIGGEFQELTGLIPDLTCLSWKWRESQGVGNYYPYGLGTLFKNQGYKTYAYHDHDYTFQDRYVYLKALGFDNFLGCGNGIEDKGVDCSIFPESDDAMILGTYKDYINDPHFMVYYATVSGHMGWNFKDNDMSIKHQSEVENLENSVTIKAFKAANLELELAMKDLLQVLKDNNHLNDTVIVLAADHHPYGLNEEEMNELANKKLDQVFELYRNDLIIYNPETENMTISKPCGTIDVLPTTLNLFGIDYDSRLIIGKDILSTSDGLVIFADGSWLNEKGRYNENTNSFESKSNQEVSAEYIDKIDKIASNRMLLSKNIMYYDYYRKIFNK